MWAALIAGFALVVAAPDAPAALADKAEAEYFAGNFAAAWVVLDDALAKDPDHSSVRPRIHLLRAAVKLKLGDPTAAADEATRALLVDPELSVSEYPADVRKLFEAALLKIPPRVVVLFSGVPKGADSRLDGRKISGGAISAVPGTHFLVVQAAGYLPYETSLEITANGMIPVALTPDPVASGRRWTSTALTGSLFGVSALSAGGGAWALDSLAVTRANKGKAVPGQRGFYDAHERRFTQQAAAGFTVATVAGAYGAYRLFRGPKPAAIVLLPTEGGMAVVVGVRFGGARRSLRASDRDGAILAARRGEAVTRTGERVERDVLDHLVPVAE